MRKKDIFIAVIVGVFTALLWTAVFIRLGTLAFLGNAVWGLVIVVPIIFIFGLYLGKWLSNWRPFFSQFSKFAIIGFFNAGIDFGVFNLLIFLSGIEKGLEIVLFKSISFITAFTNSYFWNKYWTYQAGNTQKTGQEFIKFAFITLVGFLLNVGSTSGIINFIQPQFGFSQLGWDNIAAVIGTVLNLLWNFTGYKIFVFRK